MIIRENDTEWILIEQHDHAILSEELFNQFQIDSFPSTSMLASVQFAIKMHDIGWIPFDTAPFWDDKEQSPYSFITFPMPAKIVLYKQGIDEVEQSDPYAAALCSKHYAYFFRNDDSEMAQSFITEEKNRQERLLKEYNVPSDVVSFHLQLVQFFDNLSLFLCLNHPGTPPEKTHYFFKKGILVPHKLRKTWGERLHLTWKNEEQLRCEKFPFQKTVELSIEQKRLSKAQIKNEGFLPTYTNQPTETARFIIEQA